MINKQDVSKILLLNKPIDWTSFDVVKKTRGLIKKKYSIKKIKVGHSGTLDPKASGLLIVCTGDYTKKMKDLENLNKKYVCVMKLGCVTDSFDSETKERNHKSYEHVSIQKIKSVFLDFTGDQEQKPPVFSAIKIRGERLYKKARRGELNIELKSRKVLIKKIILIEEAFPLIKFEVECSKGTYIRSLVNDIGAKLLCGAYLHSLIRTEIGHFKLKNAIHIDEIHKSI